MTDRDAARRQDPAYEVVYVVTLSNFDGTRREGFGSEDFGGHQEAAEAAQRFANQKVTEGWQVVSVLPERVW